MNINGVNTTSIININNTTFSSIAKMSNVTFVAPSPIPSGTVTTNLIMYLDAGVSASYSGSGTNWNDITYNGNDGTLVNNPTYSSANGGSILFDGIDDYIAINNVNLNIAAGQNFVWNVWLKTPPILVGYKMIFSVNTYYLYLSLFNNQFAFDSRVAPSVRFGTLTTNTWYNVTIVRDADVDYRYINGVLIDTNPNAYTPTGIFAVGKWAFNDTLFYDSNISVVSVYNETLRDSEVLQNFDTLKSRYGY